MERPYRIQELLQGCTCARVVVSEQPPRNVGEAFLHDAVLRIHPQRDALNHTERPQD